MHRSKTAIVEHAPERWQPRARELHRRGVVTTYKLHDRLLSNRRARSLYTAHRPSLDAVQLRVVKDVHEQGYAQLPFTDLFPESVWEALSGEAAEFVAAAERGLAGDEDGLQSGSRGKDFLIRRYDENSTVPLDNPWLSVCMSRKMLDIANEYLQLWSKLEYVDLWYSIPVGADAERKASQIWHRDFNDRHLLKAFLYLSDVDEHSGPFEYVPGSQPGGRYADVHPWAPMAIGRISDKELAKYVPGEGVRTFTAPRGTIIFCNTSGLHRGGFAETKPRVLAPVTYCSPASLASLTVRNYELPRGTDVKALDPVVRYAVT